MSTQPSPNQVVDHNGFIIKDQPNSDANVAPEPRAVLLRRQKEDQKQEIRLQKWRHMLGDSISLLSGLVSHFGVISISLNSLFFQVCFGYLLYTAFVSSSCCIWST
jgi:hypothetical protein